MQQQMTFQITGAERMHCEGCAQRVVRSLGMLEGVWAVTASPQTQQIQVSYDPATVGIEQVDQRLGLLGYQVSRA